MVPEFETATSNEVDRVLQTVSSATCLLVLYLFPGLLTCLGNAMWFWVPHDGVNLLEGRDWFLQP